MCFLCTVLRERFQDKKLTVKLQNQIIAGTIDRSFREPWQKVALQIKCMTDREKDIARRDADIRQREATIRRLESEQKGECIFTCVLLD